MDKCSSDEQVCDYLSSTNNISNWSLKVALIAAHAAFNARQDKLLEDILSASTSRYPESSELFEIWADFEIFRGNLEEALSYARKAQILTPQSKSAAAIVIKLQYALYEKEIADQAALMALKRFPQSSAVLWAVCKNCSSKTQYNHIFNIWKENVNFIKALPSAVRPLANAASRAELFEVASDLYLEAGIIELIGKGINRPVKEKSLAGKGGLSVISDISNALEFAGVPFFLCAGTALGIVRNGQPLDHDSDIDIGVLEENWNRDKLIEKIRNNPNFRFDIPHPRNSKIGLIHRNGASIDIFRFYRENDLLWHDGVFVRWKNSPFSLKFVEINGCKVQIPDPYDQYLTENYGDWRTPDPNFDAFNGPNTEITWTEYFEYHRVRQAYKRICLGDLDGAQKELSKIDKKIQSLPSGRQLSKIIKVL